MIGCLQPVWPGVFHHISIQTSRLQIGTRGKDHRLCMIDSSRKGLHSTDTALFHKKFCHLSLPECQMVRILQGIAHGYGVCVLICLRPQRMDRRSLGLVQHL